MCSFVAPKRKLVICFALWFRTHYRLPFVTFSPVESEKGSVCNIASFQSQTELTVSSRYTPRPIPSVWLDITIVTAFIGIGNLESDAVMHNERLHNLYSSKILLR
jgi:hypothetical protein